jgi:hypothetical protein
MAMVIKSQIRLYKIHRQLKQALLKVGVKEYLLSDFYLRILIHFKPEAIIKSDDVDEIKTLKQKYIKEFKATQSVKGIVWVVVIGVLITFVVSVIEQTINGK